MTVVSNNFTIRDNSSEFARILPEKYIEPLTIIARIKGYDGIDEYVLELIRDRLQMFVDTGDSVEWEDFQKYMHNTIIGKDVENPWAHTNEEEEEDDKEEEVDEFVKKVNNDESYNDNNLKK